MSKHTPGPWRYRRGDEWSHSIVTDHGLLPDGNESCWTVADINKRREEYEANARLISSAPDMLEALQRLDKYGHTQANWQYAKEAIAKATGETE